MSTTSKPLICIIGTTGTGKSQLAVELALALESKSEDCLYGPWNGGRVINADAMQTYEGLDIVTNKVTVGEMKGVDHRLLGSKKPGDEYFVSEWIKDALREVRSCAESLNLSGP